MWVISHSLPLNVRWGLGPWRWSRDQQLAGEGVGSSKLSQEVYNIMHISIYIYTYVYGKHSSYSFFHLLILILIVYIYISIFIYHISSMERAGERLAHLRNTVGTRGFSPFPMAGRRVIPNNRWGSGDKNGIQLSDVDSMPFFLKNHL